MLAMTWRLSALLAFSCLMSSCKEQPPEMRYIRQKIPVAIEAGKPFIVEISTSGNGANYVGVRCSRETWKVLAKEPTMIVVRLLPPNDDKRFDDKRIEISDVSPSRGSGRWSIENFSHLFQISGKRNTKARVELNFPSAPPGITHAEIIVDKTPPDTCNPFDT